MRLNQPKQARRLQAQEQTDYPDGEIKAEEALSLPKTSSDLEILAVGELAVLNRKIHRPQLRWRDRFCWVILSQIRKSWRNMLIIVKPETVINWRASSSGRILYLISSSRYAIEVEYGGDMESTQPGQDGILRQALDLLDEQKARLLEEVLQLELQHSRK